MAEGEWCLLVDVPEDRSRALAETKQALGFGMSEVHQLRKLDSACVARGTKLEMEWMRQRLDGKGIVSHARTNPVTAKGHPGGR